MEKQILKVQALREFLAEKAISRLWWCGVGSPAGEEIALDLEAEGKDYCDSQGLLDCLPSGAEEVEGEVTRDSDGEFRWDPVSLQDSDLRDCCGNTVYYLTVWAD